MKTKPQVLTPRELTERLAAAGVIITDDTVVTACRKRLLPATIGGLGMKRPRYYIKLADAQRFAKERYGVKI